MKNQCFYETCSLMSPILILRENYIAFFQAYIHRFSYVHRVLMLRKGIRGTEKQSKRISKIVLIVSVKHGHFIENFENFLKKNI